MHRNYLMKTQGTYNQNLVDQEPSAATILPFESNYRAWKQTHARALCTTANFEGGIEPKWHTGA
jgi:hypothetical protein